MPASTAGYGAATVSGATATKISYVVNSADKSILDSINFEITQDVTGMQAYLTLRTGGTNGTVVGTPITCVVGARDTTGTPFSPVTCATGTRPIASFDAIGLTVAQ